MRQIQNTLSQGLALEMVRCALGDGIPWLYSEILTFPDDHPQGNRHFLIKIQRPGHFDVEAYVRVNSLVTGASWENGSVILGYYGETGAVWALDPEEFFVFEENFRVRQVRKVVVEITPCGEGWLAQVLDNPDSTPSVRDKKETRLPNAVGISESEAIGRLVVTNSDLFHVVIR